MQTTWILSFFWSVQKWIHDEIGLICITTFMNISVRSLSLSNCYRVTTYYYYCTLFFPCASIMLVVYPFVYGTVVPHIYWMKTEIWPCVIIKLKNVIVLTVIVAIWFLTNCAGYCVRSFINLLKILPINTNRIHFSFRLSVSTAHPAVNSFNLSHGYCVQVQRRHKQTQLLQRRSSQPNPNWPAINRRNVNYPWFGLSSLDFN